MSVSSATFAPLSRSVKDSGIEPRGFAKDLPFMQQRAERALDRLAQLRGSEEQARISTSERIQAASEGAARLKEIVSKLPATASVKEREAWSQALAQAQAEQEAARSEAAEPETSSISAHISSRLTELAGWLGISQAEIEAKFQARLDRSV